MWVRAGTACGCVSLQQGRGRVPLPGVGRGSDASTWLVRHCQACDVARPPEGTRGARWRSYVGNLSPGVTDAVLKQLMEPFGNVLHAVVLLDMSTGQSRGFGFVHMDCSSAAADVRPRAAQATTCCRTRACEVLLA